MKWKRPVLGDIRKREAFLWFPKTLTKDGTLETRWLERAAWVETYIAGCCFRPDPYWSASHWVSRGV